MEVPAALSAREQKLVLFILALSSFMASLDSTIVNISLPTIAESFHIPMSEVSWVAMSYLLVLSGLLLVFGKLGDMHGFKKIFIAGFAVFTIGSLLCGLSGSIDALIGSRFVQGIGAAALEAIGPAMIAIYLPKEIRGKALGILATVISVGIAAGPIIGGLLTQYVSWHWIFFINVPIGICAVLLGMKCIPQDRHPVKTGAFDYPGAVVFFFALATLLWPIDEGLSLGWTSPAIIGSFCVSAILWVLFVFRETRCNDPLCDFDLFKNKNFLAASLAAAAMMLAFAGVQYLLPFFFEGVMGYQVYVAGLLLAVPSFALMVLGPISGSLSDKIGSRVLATGAAVFAAVAFFLISLFTEQTGILFIAGTLLCVGIALGVFFPPNMNQILGQSKKDEEGLGSSIMTTMKNVGETVGIALMGTIALFTVVTNKNFNPNTPVAQIPMEIIVEGFAVAFIAAAVIAVIAAVLSAVAEDNPR
ncbi:DHA2 family efflux MFS transporter permease subunit [Methanoregula sp. UBA64]|jgi:EmrB/QacA subfamily drug resistance transporter|uniref:DHA2 family efflux MFS transporter permease subunit n=1 Tax=Methanoregula sp. UBA64 TaxID=1915554 RepID=UPI0025D2B280|nr:DHA2 family efflux MFS transporter permease subunit [Methanoregula sp. UBA64]